MNRFEQEYKQAIDAAENQKPATFLILMFALIIGFISFTFIWASITEIEELTRGQGQVTPSQEVQIVQSLEGGIIQEILVKEGNTVKKGEILLRISDVLFSSEERSTEARFLSLEAKKYRLIAESENKQFEVPETLTNKIPDIIANERALHESRQKELQAAFKIQDENINKAQADDAETKQEINRLNESLRLLNKELTITREMVAQRAVPKLDQIRLEREQADIKGQIKARKEERKGLQAVLASVQGERQAQTDKFTSIALEELSEVETQIATLRESLRSMEDRVNRTEIRSPVDGVINQISLNTIGGVVEPAMKLVEIVPLNDTLKIVAQIQPKDIAFLKVGQPVKVKVTAYDPQIYGALDGRLSRVAATSTTDHEGSVMFEVEVLTDKTHLGTSTNQLPITAGMIADIEVITGKRTILNFIMKPLRRGFNRALRER